MRRILKKIFFGAAILWASPLIIATKIGFAFRNDAIFNVASTFLSLLPGKTGNYIRVAYYWGTLKKMSQDASIGFGSFFSKRSAVVHSNVYIGAYCILGNVHIGDNVFIASRVSIPSGRHQHGGAATFSPGNQENCYDKVEIGCGSWIGEAAVVMADVGRNCIVGGGSVVVKPVGDGCVAIGNPAKIKFREITSSG